MHNFKVHLTNSAGDCNDCFTISIDQRIINRYLLDTNIVEFDVELTPGHHSLCIELFKNSRNYTKIQIDEIFINGSAMKYMLNDYGQVIPNWLRDPGLKEWYVQTQGHAPDYFAKRRTLDIEGIYQFQFRMPLREFMEEFYQLPEAYKSQYNKSLEKYTRLQERLNGAQPK